MTLLDNGLSRLHAGLVISVCPALARINLLTCQKHCEDNDIMSGLQLFIIQQISSHRHRLSFQIDSEYLEAIKVIKTRCVRLKTRAETVGSLCRLP